MVSKAHLPSWRADKRKTAERGYGSRWQRERLEFLQRNPLCCMCEASGIIRSATTVDHRIPHQGDQLLFWSQANWQSLCTTHHNSDKQMLEKSGRVRETIGPDGYPI